MAKQAAPSAPVRVTVVVGEAAELPGSRGDFDAAFASLVLCSVADVPGVLTEIARVLRPGGEPRESGSADGCFGVPVGMAAVTPALQQVGGLAGIPGTRLRSTRK
ncbi:class I SAM-dependent methyltransferase [Streptomyces sp. NL15-2K]|uniref:class I SAM-dependent methyltransferase n=1 Tax=Streptomyces sp. NL15-2K TaxID=376149 RepID=UPI000FF92C1B|nr:class I SAM-dependent methyltransferase [Streptomyces sp. NL15-2K]GCB50755.1 hypothetical protein SNL152K_8101 [Streptomyces sp. NL15-2K]